MKFLIIIVVIAAVAAALWLRTARRGPGSVPSRHPHRLDDSVGPRPPSDLRLDAPSTGAGAASGQDAGDVGAQPGSDFAWEPEVSGTDSDAAGDDPRPPGARPGE